MTEEDVIEHPRHYTSHPSGIECIEITEHMGFCLGNAFKYITRLGLKDDIAQDLRKAVWYIDREIDKREGEAPSLKDIAERKEKITKWCDSELDDRLATIYEALWSVDQEHEDGTGALLMIRSILSDEATILEREP